MKKLVIILGSVMLVAAVAYPVFAHGPGWGKGHHMWGPGGKGPGSCWRSDRGYGNLTQEQRGQLDKLHQKFLDETAAIRSAMWAKSGELRILLNTTNPDAEKAKALQTELSNLQAKLAQKRIELKLEARKIAPQGAYFGRFGRGFGHHMGYGRHMGYGPGRCWN